MRSTRSCNRARTSSGGFALFAALAVAILYFGVIELVLIDSARELSEANRFRARVVAATLAENGAELAAHQMTQTGSLQSQASATDWQGSIRGTLRKTAGGEFEIDAEGKSAGLAATRATVRVYGRVNGNRILIDYTMHSQ